MRYFNPMHPRKWTKLFVPLSTFFHQLGTQLGVQSAAYADRSSAHDPSVVGSSFIAKLLASFRSRCPDGNGSYQLHSNGVLKHETSNYMYHQLDLPARNDENNNDTNPHSFVLHFAPATDSEPLLHTSDGRCAFVREHLVLIILVSSLYFLWFACIAGISIVHVLIYSALLFLCVLSERTRRFALAILIYLTYLLLYDALHLVPNYTISNIHIGDVYFLEKQLFGVYKNGHVLTLNEYFRQSHIPLLDILTGLCYLNWIPIPIAYSLYLYRYRTKRDYMDFAFTFLLTNMLGFVVYYIIPTAPPWYIELYGFEFNINARGNPAGFIHFDQITGVQLFSSMYSKNANVFAAIPSLHAAYPLITVLYGSLSKRLWVHLAFVAFTLAVWFSAVYSRHHYVLDVLAGGMCALTAFVLYRILSRIPTVNRLLTAYSKAI